MELPPLPPSEHALQLMQLPQNPLVEGEQFPFLMYNPMITDQDEDQGLFDLAMPDLMAGADDWAFQGVDTTFFHRLIGNNAMDQGGWESSWSGL